MHSTKDLHSSDFNFYAHGQKSSIEEFFPDFNFNDRLGIVVTSPGGSIGAASLYMAAITKYYDYVRSKLGNEGKKLRIYPDYYVFHIQRKHFNHYWMDIWPSHKEIIVKNGAQELLEAINDRGITRLILEEANVDVNQSQPFSREAYNSAYYRIKTSVAYSNRNEKTPLDYPLQVMGPNKVEEYIKWTIADLDDAAASAYTAYRSSCSTDQGAPQKNIDSFRHLSLKETLHILASYNTENSAFLVKE